MAIQIDPRSQEESTPGLTSNRPINLTQILGQGVHSDTLLRIT